jgi:hypothetical protein
MRSVILGECEQRLEPSVSLAAVLLAATEAGRQVGRQAASHATRVCLPACFSIPFALQNGRPTNQPERARACPPAVLTYAIPGAEPRGHDGELAKGAARARQGARGGVATLRARHRAAGASVPRAHDVAFVARLALRRRGTVGTALGAGQAGRGVAAIVRPREVVGSVARRTL